MKKAAIFLLILMHITIRSYSQNISTNNIVFNFDPGDVFHYYTHTSDDYGPITTVSNYTITHVFYTMTKHYVRSFQRESYYDMKGPVINYEAGMDTLSIIHLDSLVNYGNIDTIIQYSNYNQHKLMHYSRLDSSTSLNLSIQFADSLGIVYWENVDTTTSIYVGKMYERLVYFKKGTEEWGSQHWLSLEERVFPEYKIEIFPNPLKTYLNLRHNSPQSPQIKIFNVHGQEQKIGNLKYRKGEKTISLQHLSSGIYFIQLTLEKEIKVMKFIKQ